jgi:hypothetical protein
LSGKFFWFKYRTLVLPYYTHLLRAANIPYWLTHPVCVCVRIRHKNVKRKLGCEKRVSSKSTLIGWENK